MYPILFVELLKNASYKNVVLLSMMHKQFTYFSKKYSKSNKITLGNNTNKLLDKCEKDNIKVIKYGNKKVNLIKYNNFVFENAKSKNIKTVRYFLNNGFNANIKIQIIKRRPVSNCCRLLSFIDVTYRTLLTHCASHDCSRIIKLLLSHYNVNMCAIECNEALKICVEKGYITSIKILLELCAYIDVNRVLLTGFQNVEVIKLSIKIRSKYKHRRQFCINTKCSLWMC